MTALAAWAGRAWESVKVVVPSLLDLHLYGGGALLVYGVSQVWAPGAWIAGGALLVTLGVWQIRRAEGAGS